MKVSIIVVSLTLLGATGAALAQGSTTIVEPTITVGSTEPTPESPAIARKEAGAALAQAKQECRKEGDRDTQQSCLADARADYDNMMAMATSKR